MMNKNIYIFAGIILAVVIAISLMGGGSSGNVVLKNLPEGTAIFVDGKEEAVLDKDQAEFNLNIGEGEREIITSLNNRWPWLEVVGVKKGESYELNPFMTPINGTGLLILSDDPIYGDLVSRINRDTLPTKNAKLLSADNKVAVWVENNSIKVEWVSSDPAPKFFCYSEECPSVVTVLDLVGKIKNLGFYADRNDALVFSMGTGVFVVEVDPFGNQNFQPVYEGKNPEFIFKTGSIIYVRDSGQIREYGI